MMSTLREPTHRFDSVRFALLRRKRCERAAFCVELNALRAHLDLQDGPMENRML
jgi:hypothetical protein